MTDFLKDINFPSERDKVIFWLTTSRPVYFRYALYTWPMNLLQSDWLNGNLPFWFELELLNGPGSKSIQSKRKLKNLRRFTKLERIWRRSVECWPIPFLKRLFFR
jgi:hypothetical protein